MSAHNPPLCKNCYGILNKNAIPEASLNHVLDSLNKMKTPVKIVLGIGVIAILGLIVFIQTKAFPRFLGINITFLRYIPFAFLALLVGAGGLVLLGRKFSFKLKKECITTAQIETLLKMDNRLTPSRLASATNVSIEYAKKVLNNLVVEGKLNVSTSIHELIYSKDLLPEKDV
jgi:hypothetical protein